MKIRAKKKGTTFLEIVLALSIIGVISVAIFNNIYFSLRQNKMAEKRQQESLVQQMVFEELTSLGDSEFRDMLRSLDNDSEDSYSFLPGEFVENKNISTKNYLAEGSERIDQFKVYQKRGTDIYVKIYFEDFTRGNENLGVDKNYTVSGVDVSDADTWKGQNECPLVFILDKKTVAGETKYSFEITGSNMNVQVKYEGLELDDLEGIIKLDDKGELLIKNIRKADKRFMITGNDFDIFIKNITEENVPFKILNDSEKTMNIYVDQKLKNGVDGRVSFTTYGDKIKFYMNDSVANPDAERMERHSMCEFKISVFEFSNGSFKKHSSIPGYKKFKRFDI